MKLAAALLSQTAAGGGGGSSCDCLSQVLPGKECLIIPESRFFIIGMKSYGRSSSFLLRIGREQIEQIAELLRSEIWEE